MKRYISLFLIFLAAFAADSYARSRETVLLNNGWTFHLGDASSPEKDFGHGTEYFTYVCKIGAHDHNRGPAWPGFDDSSWQKVSLPHDWVVDLPFSGEASHSHGYKCVGWKYPENSVGWYRKHFTIPEEDRGRIITVHFDGIFRDSQVFCNGIYLGGESSGYIPQSYDLTPYINYGGDNVLSVRADASLEEGWFYEGAGIYRDVHLVKTGPIRFDPMTFRVKVSEGLGTDLWLNVSSRLEGDVKSDAHTFGLRLYNAEGEMLIDYRSTREHRAPSYSVDFRLPKDLHLWSVDDPYLYTVKLTAYIDGEPVDEYSVRYGFRTAGFSPEQGFLLNGEKLTIRGANIHQDHAGVGSGIPRELWRYRIARLKEFGFNAVRCSHNPASSALLDVCDELGMLVLEENRQFGVNREQLRQLETMICRDRNRACIIAWSIGNEEWFVESREMGAAIASTMREYALRFDSTRPFTYGDSGGNAILGTLDVNGYNYIRQNHIDRDRAEHPQWCGWGTEETTGCGTRGKYETVPENGWMAPINLTGNDRGEKDLIRYGWEFYRDRPWLAGLFYWTGFDYRGEPNPMAWPATGSQFGIFDYCGFPKDEAYYLLGEWTCKDNTIPGPPTETVLLATRTTLVGDGQDVTVLDIDSPEPRLEISIEGPVEMLGWGNGDPGFKLSERASDVIHPFCGKAQVLLRSIENASGNAAVTVGGKRIDISVLPCNE